MGKELDVRVAKALGNYVDHPCDFDVDLDIQRFKDATWECLICGYQGSVDKLWRWTDFSHNVAVMQYSTKIAYAWTLGAELAGEEVAVFIKALCDICGVDQELLFYDGVDWASVEALNMLVYATPEQRCRAFLVARGADYPPPGAT